MDDWIVLYRLVLFLGAVQGVVMGAILWQGERQHSQYRANRILSVILIFFSYRLAVQLWYSQEIKAYESWLYHIFLEFNWIYGPLVFFYVKALLRPEDRVLHWSNRWHFLPVVLEFLFSNYVKSQNFYWDGNPESLSWAGRSSYVLWMHTPLQFVVAAGLILYYALLSKQRLRKANNRTQGWRLTRSSNRRVGTFLNMYIAYSVIVLILSVADYCFFNYAFNPFYRYPLYGGLALITYWLGLQGVLYRNENTTEKIALPEKDEQLKEIAGRLEKIMQDEKPYLDPALSISSLAERVGTKPYLLTKALNSLLGKTFNEVINEYRVEEFKRRVNDPAYAKFTLLSIAYDSGFNSKATYNRTVKRLTGKSPRELRKVVQDHTK